jgi:hypothetical protein
MFRERKSLLLCKGDFIMSSVCSFKFTKGIDRESIEKQLALAIVSTECTFGQPKVRINASYYILPKDKIGSIKDEVKVVIDVSNGIGEHIAQLFTGLIIRQFGENGFIVNKENETSSHQR